MNLTETEKAYIAGIIDGEGCISIQKKHYVLRIMIGSTDERILNYLLGKVGGYVSRRKRRKYNWKICNVWAVGSSKAEQLLKDVFPYLILKKEQADVALRLRATFDGRAGLIGKSLEESVCQERNKLYEQMTKLNKRGI